MFQTLINLFIDDKGKFKKGHSLLQGVVTAIVIGAVYLSYQGVVYAVEDQTDQDAVIAQVKKLAETNEREIKKRTPLSKEDVRKEFEGFTKSQQDLYLKLLDKTESSVKDQLDRSMQQNEKLVNGLADQHKANQDQIAALTQLLASQMQENESQRKQIKQLGELIANDSEAQKVLSQNLTTLMRESQNSKLENAKLISELQEAISKLSEKEQ